MRVGGCEVWRGVCGVGVRVPSGGGQWTVTSHLTLDRKGESKLL